GIAEISLREFSPVKAIVALGSGLILTVVVSFSLFLNSLNMAPRDFVLQRIKESSDVIALQKKAIEESGDRNSIEILQVLSNDETMADVALKQLPGYLI